MRSFKKVFSGILAAAICGGISAGSISASGTTYKRGDVNGDGSVTIIDVTYHQQFLNGRYKSSNDHMTQRLDVNCDGVIDIEDRETISYITLGEITSDNVAYNTIDGDITSSYSRAYKVYDAQSGSFIENYTLAASNQLPDSSVYSIVGTDTRQVDYSKSGVVYLKMNCNGKETCGTGFVVGEHTILTAAHCVFDTYNNNIPVSNVRYTLFNANGISAMSSVPAVSYHVPQEYVNYTLPFYEEEIDGDYALITTSEDLSDYMCFDLGIARKAMINSKDRVYPNENMRLYVTGYNAESVFMGRITTGFDYLTNNSNDGSSIINGRIAFDTDVVSGQSGSPLYIVKPDGRMTVIGIVTSQIRNNNNSQVYNSGKRIDVDILKFVYNNPNL